MPKDDSELHLRKGQRVKDIVKIDDRDGWYEVRSEIDNPSHSSLAAVLTRRQSSLLNSVEKIRRCENEKNPEAYFSSFIFQIKSNGFPNTLSTRHKRNNFSSSFFSQGTCDDVRGYFHQDYVIIKTESRQ